MHYLLRISLTFFMRTSTNMCKIYNFYRFFFAAKTSGCNIRYPKNLIYLISHIIIFIYDKVGQTNYENTGMANILMLCKPVT